MHPLVSSFNFYTETEHTPRIKELLNRALNVIVPQQSLLEEEWITVNENLRYVQRGDYQLKNILIHASHPHSNKAVKGIIEWPCMRKQWDQVFHSGEILRVINENTVLGQVTTKATWPLQGRYMQCILTRLESDEMYISLAFSVPSTVPSKYTEAHLEMSVFIVYKDTIHLIIKSDPGGALNNVASVFMNHIVPSYLRNIEGMQLSVPSVSYAKGVEWFGYKIGRLEFKLTGTSEVCVEDFSLDLVIICEEEVEYKAEGNMLSIRANYAGSLALVDESSEGRGIRVNCTKAKDERVTKRQVPQQLPRLLLEYKRIMEALPTSVYYSSLTPEECFALSPSYQIQRYFNATVTRLNYGVSAYSMTGLFGGRGLILDKILRVRDGLKYVIILDKLGIILEPVVEAPLIRNLQPRVTTRISVVGKTSIDIEGIFKQGDVPAIRLYSNTQKQSEGKNQEFEFELREMFMFSYTYDDESYVLNVKPVVSHSVFDIQLKWEYTMDIDSEDTMISRDIFISERMERTIDEKFYFVTLRVDTLSEFTVTLKKGKMRRRIAIVKKIEWIALVVVAIIAVFLVTVVKIS